MLEGLEVSEIYKSTLERTVRIDSEFYAKDNLIAQKTLEELNSKSITQYVKVSDGNHMSISEHFVEKGIPYYRGGDIYNFFIEQVQNPLHIPKKVFEWKNMKRSHLNKGDVLISIVGAIIGNLSLVKTNEDATCSCKLAILRPKSLSPELIAIFLKSKFGQSQIQKFRRGTGQTGFILEDFDQILIPSFSNDYSSKIRDIVNSSFENLEISLKKYSHAQSLLLKNLGLRDFEPSKEPVNIKNFKESFLGTGRLDAEYYQKKYEEYESLILSRKNTLIKDEYTHVKTQAKKDKGGYNYIEIGDIDVGDGTNKSNYIITEDLPANAKIIVQKGDIIISNVRPYRGAVSIINSDEKDIIVSGAFTVLRRNKKSIFNNEVLKVILRTQIYKDWLLKFNVGTSYPVIKDDDVLNLPIPFIEETMQIQIAELVEESLRLKSESEKLLELAKLAVEMAIEEGEEKATEFINRAMLT